MCNFNPFSAFGLLEAKTPSPRSYEDETTRTLRAQLGLAPEIYAAEAKYRPLFAGLDVGVLNKTLLGTGEQRGLLDIYAKDIAPALRQQFIKDTQSQRESDIGAVSQLGAAASAATRAADPERAALADEMLRQAREEINAGPNLNPPLQRLISQNVRAGQAARGLGAGPTDVYEEALATGEFGQQLLGQRQQNAARVLALRSALQGDPYLAILGRPSQNAFGYAQALGGQASGFNPGQMFRPESQYAGDIFSQGYQTKFAASAANAANQAQILSSLIGGGSKIIGSYLGRGR